MSIDAIGDVVEKWRWSDRSCGGHKTQQNMKTTLVLLDESLDDTFQGFKSGITLLSTWSREPLLNDAIVRYCSAVNPFCSVLT
eukprot:m.67035 g.67035  ORF g.67035 m.67035 type:complete len:83 (+) comp18160_c0_seq1:165-413(+)